MSNHFSSELQRINSYNVDSLLKAVFTWDDPQQVRQDLLALYFYAAQSIFNDGAGCGNLADAFSTLQAIIEAIGEADKVNEAQFAVTIK